MLEHDAIAAALSVIAACGRQAARYEPSSAVYRIQSDSAEQALRRVTVLAEPLTAGQPRHRKAARTLRNAVSNAQRCVAAIGTYSSVTVLESRADAVERAAMAVYGLSAGLVGELAQSEDELVVGESACAQLPDVMDAFRAIHGGDAVEDQGTDEPAAIATLGASDEHTRAAQ